MRIYFAIPDPAEFISGGNIYNAQLTDALKKAGHIVEIGPVDGITKGSFDRYIVDSIYFDALDGVEVIAEKTAGLVHHLNSLYPLSKTQFEEKERPILNRFGKLIVTSGFTENYVGRSTSPKDILVLEPVAPTIDKTMTISTGKINALMLANITPRKGILEFLENLKTALLPPDYSLTIAGDTTSDRTYADRCTELARLDKNLSRTVRFTGLQDDTALDKIWRKSNLFISSSFMETFGMAIQEAVVRGIPVLVLRGGHTGAHVKEGVNGHVAGSMDDLVKLFGRLLKNPLSFQKLVKTAQNFQHNYEVSWDRQAERLIDFLTDRHPTSQ